MNRGTGQNTVISDRALMEVWAHPYRDAIAKADLGSAMCSFNKINGEYACESDYALETVLRERLGFDGFVITDFGAIHSTEPSIRAGTDMETGTAAFYDGALLAAVEDGTVPESLVDRSVLRILRTMFAVGVFDTEYGMSPIPVAEHGAVAREVEEDAITLLRNRGVLPLDEDTGLDRADRRGREHPRLDRRLRARGADLRGVGARRARRPRRRDRRELPLGAGQRPGQRREHDRDGRHVGRAVVGPDAGVRLRPRADRPLLGQPDVPGHRGP